MQKSIIRKVLVAGIIVLFLGIGVQTAFAIEISNVKPSSENIEDCNCQVIDNYKLEKYKNQIDKLETYSKLLLTLSKNYPKVEVEYQKLLNDIDLFKGIYDNLENYKSVNNRPICDFLTNIYWDIYDIAIKYSALLADMDFSILF